MERDSRAVQGRSVSGAAPREAVERPEPSQERGTQAPTEQGQLCEHWANLAGLGGLPALLVPPQTCRSVPGSGLGAGRASRLAAFVWALLLLPYPLSHFHRVEKKFLKTASHSLQKHGSQGPCDT